MCFFRENYYILKQTDNPTVFNIIRTPDLSKNSIVASFSMSLEKAKSIESFLVLANNEGSIKYLLSGSL
jgi:hypothetical protein